MPAVPAIMAATSIAGVAMSASAMNAQKKAAAQAAEAAKNAGVNIPQVQQMAQDQALRNIELSNQVEQRYAPENAAFRTGSLLGLMNGLTGVGDHSDIQKYLDAAAKSGQYTPVGGNLTAQQANSDLLNNAISKAQSDLALGGNLPQDVKNQIARSAAATAGRVAGPGNISGLGRDITLRDLGLNSLSLQQQRLQNAQALGQAQLGANQFNANARFAADQGNLAARQFDAQMGMQAGNQNLSIAQLLANLKANDFNQLFSAAQFGQSIQKPVVGLDPSAIANLAVGNSNAQQSAAQNAAAMQGQAAQGLGQLGGQLTGMGMMGLGMYNTPKPATPYTPFSSPQPGTAGYLASNIFK